MKNVLIVSGHTDLKNDSVVNKNIIEELKKQLPDAEFDVLSELYPDFNINVAVEQEKLRKADVVVLQFPVFWYSMPSLLRRWIENVFVHGFAHGSTGTALHGKKLIASFTAGAPEVVYAKDSFVEYTIDEIMDVQFKTLAKLCGMELQPYVVTFGVSYIERSNADALQGMQARAKEHVERLIKLVQND